MQSTISIPQLRAALNGRVITPDDARYDEARAVFYGGIDHHPAVIVRVADAADVSRVVELARETRLELAIRGGGHSNAGHGVSDGGIVLDLGDLRTLNIDVAGRMAWRPGSLGEDLRCFGRRSRTALSGSVTRSGLPRVRRSVRSVEGWRR